MKLTIKKATKTQSRGRIALVGPAGSGKTYTGLVWARAIAGDSGRILCVDTERGSASKYSGESGIGDFDVIELDTHEPATYVEALKLGAAEGYDVIVVDSLSHAWSGRGGALEQVDRATARSRSGNSFGAWREVTPMHNALVDALLTSPAHVIVTMRAKTEYVLEADARGKQTPRKVGMAPVQRDGMEYEFDLVVDLDWEHCATVSKSRCSAVSGAVWRKPGVEAIAPFVAWLTDGAPAAPALPPPDVDGIVAAFRAAKTVTAYKVAAKAAKDAWPSLDALAKDVINAEMATAQARIKAAQSEAASERWPASVLERRRPTHDDAGDDVHDPSADEDWHQERGMGDA